MSERLLPLVRPIYETEGEIADVKRSIDGNSDLQAQLEHQIRFDDQIVSDLQTIALNDQQIEELENLLVENTPSDVASAPAAPTPQAVIPPSPGPQLVIPVPPVPEPVVQAAPVLESITPVAAPLQPDPVVPATKAAPEHRETPPSESEKTGEKPVEPGAEAEEAGEKEEEKEEEAPRARPITILAAVGIGIIATIALIAYMVWDQMNTFSGADQVAELLNTANVLNGDEFEAVSTTTANLKDWFFLKSDMRWFAVPKEFADTTTLGCRVFKFKGADVGQILAKSDKEVLMFLFHPTDLGVRIRKGKWAIVDGENWEGAVTAVEDCCFIVAFKGKHKDMQDYLDKKLKK